MTPITTPFGARTDADEIVAGVRLPDHRMVVTGGASGIGLETVRALARTGAEVTVAVRRLDEGVRAARAIADDTGNPAVRAIHLDLADLASVRAMADAWEGPLDVLVANAGVMACPLSRTAQGWEMQFATNHLGHFALATGLHGALAANGRGRVVSVSSSGHRSSPIVFDDIHFRERPYDPGSAYGQSKTANILFAVEAARRWAADGIVANALMPGGIWTPLQRHADEDTRAEWARAEAAGELSFMKTPQQGAATSVLLAASPLVEGVTGRYFEDCNESTGPDTPVTGVSDHALDPDAAARLWDVSLAMIGAA